MKLKVERETWPLKQAFRTARRRIDSVETVLVTLEEDGAIGRGEAVGVNYNGETAASVAGQIEQFREQLEGGISREALQTMLPAGGARNALDCALWDLECKRTGKSIWELTDIEPKPVTTAYTIVIDKPHRMYAAAADAPESVLKIKVSAEGGLEQVRAVREARPDARLIVDANQDFTLSSLETFIAAVESLGVEMIEQPLPVGGEAGLKDFASPIPLCADESFQDAGDLDAISGLYAYANIKLEKAGGLTAALDTARRAEAAGVGLMVGCWAATSLSMAPAFVIAQFCAWADIDGPLLLAEDRENAMTYRKGIVTQPERALWG